MFIPFRCVRSGEGRSHEQKRTAKAPVCQRGSGDNGKWQLTDGQFGITSDRSWADSERWRSARRIEADESAGQRKARFRRIHV
jgi:hypothetical protein